MVFASVFSKWVLWQVEIDLQQFQIKTSGRSRVKFTPSSALLIYLEPLWSRKCEFDLSLTLEIIHKQFSPPNRNFDTSGATEPSIIKICWGIGKKTIEMKGKEERRRGASTGGWAHIPTTVSSGPEVVGSRLHLLCTAHYALCTNNV